MLAAGVIGQESVVLQLLENGRLELKIQTVKLQLYYLNRRQKGIFNLHGVICNSFCDLEI